MRRGHGLAVTDAKAALSLGRGADYLAAIWTAAWKVGQGATRIADQGLVAPKDLIELYSDRDELPSMHLDTIEPVLAAQPVHA